MERSMYMRTDLIETLTFEFIANARGRGNWIWGNTTGILVLLLVSKEAKVWCLGPEKTGTHQGMKYLRENLRKIRKSVPGTRNLLFYRSEFMLLHLSQQQKGKQMLCKYNDTNVFKIFFSVKCVKDSFGANAWHCEISYLPSRWQSIWRPRALYHR